MEKGWGLFDGSTLLPIIKCRLSPVLFMITPLGFSLNMLPLVTDIIILLCDTEITEEL